MLDACILACSYDLMELKLTLMVEVFNAISMALWENVSQLRDISLILGCLGSMRL